MSFSFFFLCSYGGGDQRAGTDRSAAVYWSIASRSSGSATAMPASRPTWARIPVELVIGVVSHLTNAGLVISLAASLGATRTPTAPATALPAPSPPAALPSSV